MAHEIEGNSAFYVGQPAWHKLGVVLANAPTYEEAWKLAYPHVLYKENFEVVIKRNGQELRAPIQDFQMVIRDDGKEIGPVMRSYELLQPYELMKGFERYLDAGLVELEAGGSLYEGRQMWGLGKLVAGEADIVPGDTIKGYVLAATGFDGSRSYTEMITGTRVVCANTLHMAADSSGTRGMKFKVRHTKNMRDRIDSVKDNIQIFLSQFNRTVDQYKALAAKKMTHQEQVNFVTRVFITDEMLKTMKEEKKDPSPQLMTKVNRVIELIDQQAGLDLVPAIKGTAWQAYNAVSQYLTHEQGRTDATRLQNQWFGQAVDLNARAYNLLAN